MAVGVYEYDTVRGESKKIIESFGRELNEDDVVLVGLRPQAKEAGVRLRRFNSQGNFLLI